MYKNNIYDFPVNSDSIYKKLITILKPYTIVLIFAIVSLICSKLIEAGTIKFLSPKLFDEVLVTKNFNSVRFISMAALLALILRATFGFITKFLIGYLTKNISKDLRSKILIHMLCLPISFFKQNAIGNLISKVNYDVEQITRALSDAVLELLSSVVTIIFFIGVMLSFSWQVTMMALLISPIIAWFLRNVNARIRKYSSRLQNSVGDVSHLTHEIIEACQVIRIFEAIPQETKRINKLINYNFKQDLKIVLVSAISESIMLITLGSVFVILIYIATGKSLQISPGCFVGLFTAMFGLIRPLKQLSEINYVLAKGLAAADSIFGLLATKLETNDVSKNIEVRPESVYVLERINTPSMISLNNVSFDYGNNTVNNTANDNKTILCNISLIFKAGQTTAIVGRSGSGKSTLVGLLPRFYHVSSGEICLNGININNLDLYELRKYFAVVNQRIILLNDTVANNIAYGCMQNATREQILAAAEAANAMEFIEQLPNGLDTSIGSNGNLLSGGQRQRISIARAVLKNAPILILDEATSALDIKSEQQIQSALEKLMVGKTTIIIAHRMSTIEHADQIAVLENGRLVAVGNHKGLIKDVYYANLHNTVINESL